MTVTLPIHPTGTTYAAAISPKADSTKCSAPPAEKRSSSSLPSSLPSASAPTAVVAVAAAAADVVAGTAPPSPPAASVPNGGAGDARGDGATCDDSALLILGLRLLLLQP